MTDTLSDRLVARIRETGPITVAAYMAECLADPGDGYYMRGDPFGTAGDFVTAPEVSQMFGELIGAWTLALWYKIGAPDPVRLVELGPGRGTLMADFLRVASLDPAFLKAASLHLVEISPALKQRQAETLSGAPLTPEWHDRFEDVPDGPALVVANEFFDALPVHQFVRTESGWQERLVGLDADGALAFVVGSTRLPDTAVPAACRGAKVGAILETSPASTAAMAAIADRIVKHGGGALAIDYGHLATAPGDTFQAVRGHAYADPLKKPGQADLTAHVDFQALGEAAEAAGAVAHSGLTQADFLLRLGLIERAGRLGHGQEERVQNDIRDAVERLAGPDAMGHLFKVLAVTGPGILPEPFDSRPAAPHDP
ncbi:SAM-dependent MidA family methyltransferase [Rhodobium orientis]|uniref:Methyltransferase n=1 Tax=Rhodobium orientis TaxID=34017 RepID=A0A327JVE7_9HYPH|nr:class I SAM-dependent methyltransferase [Rhodobium orientis]MBB4301179.1 SAM-dependent MidA family methyltransferase [Rhodobium orientis]MBK5949810.1 methyltransferase [Rhodobium orientis]RAI30051.1 methyltransferase [Rhodobium orientis]